MKNILLMATGSVENLCTRLAMWAAYYYCRCNCFAQFCMKKDETSNSNCCHETTVKSHTRNVPRSKCTALALES